MCLDPESKAMANGDSKGKQTAKNICNRRQKKRRESESAAHVDRDVIGSIDAGVCPRKHIVVQRNKAMYNETKTIGENRYTVWLKTTTTTTSTTTIKITQQLSSNR